MTIDGRLADLISRHTRVAKTLGLGAALGSLALGFGIELGPTLKTGGGDSTPTQRPVEIHASSVAEPTNSPAATQAKPNQHKKGLLNGRITN